MNERIFILEDTDPQIFYGTNSRNLHLLRETHPKLRIAARGNIIKVMGSPEEMKAFIKLLSQMEKYATEYNVLPEQVIREMIQGEHTIMVNNRDDVIIHGAGGRPITPRSDHQAKMIQLIGEKDLVFATGPAGSGKTFLAIVMAVKMLKNKSARRIILSRPAVEAGEKLGFLPGEMKDKLDPYLQPLYDALQELIPPAKLRDHIENSVIQIAPLAYMRGRTLNDAVIILDEAQNTTPHQMKMFLTRLGHNAKMIITGDITQVDLPKGIPSGLKQAKQILQNTSGIGWIDFEKKDIMRHGLVQDIVEAYDHFDRQNKERMRSDY